MLLREQFQLQELKIFIKIPILFKYIQSRKTLASDASKKRGWQRKKPESGHERGRPHLVFLKRPEVGQVKFSHRLLGDEKFAFTRNFISASIRRLGYENGSIYQITLQLRVKPWIHSTFYYQVIFLKWKFRVRDAINLSYVRYTYI